MAKKYSVQIEDDEVVSVEVDGVQYNDPDQIPDEKDREKIQDLLANASAADFEREFKESFREMERQSNQLSKLIPLIFLAISALMLVIAAISTVSTLRKLAREQSAPGQVVDMVVRSSRDSETQEITDFYYPVVEFDVANGSHKRVQLSEGSSPAGYEIGQPVTILYDPERPLDARIKSTSSTVLMWILPGITGIVGIVFLAAAVLVFRFFSAESSSSSE